jgi:hypothetical protein
MADLAADAQRWIERQFRDPGSPGVALLRRVAGEEADRARVKVHHRTGRTAESVHVRERTAHDGTLWFQVVARRPQADVLNSDSGVIRNPGPRTGELTRTGRRRRSSTGRSVRPAHPFWPRTKVL